MPLLGLRRSFFTALTFSPLIAMLLTPSIMASGGSAFVRTWGGPNTDRGSGVAFDSSGNAFVTGQTASFGTGAFLLKYSPQGELLWQKVCNGTKPTRGDSVATDLAGNVYMVGTLANETLLSKLNPSGGVLWQKNWTGYPGTSGLAVAPTGDIYVAGGYAGQLLLVKFNSSGALIWQKSSNVTRDGGGATVDAAGDIYIVSSNPVAAVLKVNSTGSIEWAKDWTGGVGASIASDPLGNAYVAGSVGGAVDSSNAVITKFAPNGSLLWQRVWPSIPSSIFVGVAGLGISADGSGNIYVTGDDNDNLFLLRLDSDGGLTSAFLWGPGAYGESIAVDSSGVPAIVGVIMGDLASKGRLSADRSLTKLNPTVSTLVGQMKNATVTSSDVVIPLSDVNGKTTATAGDVDVLLSYGSSLPVPIFAPLPVILISGFLIYSVTRIFLKRQRLKYSD